MYVRQILATRAKSFPELTRRKQRKHWGRERRAPKFVHAVHVVCLFGLPVLCALLHVYSKEITTATFLKLPLTVTTLLREAKPQSETAFSVCLPT